MANLTAFKGKIGYGIRPNLFEVTIPSLPTGIGAFTTPAGDVNGADSEFRFLCRSAGIPASSIGTVEVPFRGRVIKLPGDRTFESWTVTIMGDPNLSIRSYFEKWMDKLNEHTSGAGYTGGASAADFMGTLQVDQHQRGTGAPGGGTPAPHSVLRSYQFLNSFPTNISQIDLSYDNNNSIAEYTVEFQYDYWVVSTAAAGSDSAGNGTI